ncbi:uroporphyrinogen-III synthase [Methanomicrobiaceae archaeon CYW5]|uniref:uroporphyrinogen-III synthase n=1 Tax=Methanovulcanius yangii TaxID=1789227 RepID=UPI0029CA0DF5|nr:uroporphyrinogen-III synthase [Methanovulcanius yangii]MBT8508046.1 uroporphyrinogen-III synthase [Methanovulcanius yangii]
MKIAITRLPEKADTDQALCMQYGHECLIVSPLEATAYEGKCREFLTAANRGDFDCIFFTSALPARYLAPELRTDARVIAIGPQTARTLAESGITSEILPTHYSRDFAPYLGEWLRGKTVGIPRADVPNPALLTSIEDYGGTAAEIPVYALEATGTPLNLAGADAILFTSANSYSLAKWQNRPGLLLIAIGEITAERMQEGGDEPDITGDGTLEGTLRELNIYLNQDES